MRKLSLKLLPMTTAIVVTVLSISITSGLLWSTPSASAASTSVAQPLIRKAGTALPSWWVTSALCVHHYEGSWTDPNGPYYGGMQMDVGFQTAYGYWAYKRWGTADHWPKWVQLQVAYEGWKHRGWWPWPNTARYCHLL